MTDPAAASTAWLTKFSEAISSRPEFCRWISLRIAPSISGSVSASVRQRVGDWAGAAMYLCLLNLGDLVDAPLVAASLERRLEPQLQDFVQIGRASCRERV